MRRAPAVGLVQMAALCCAVGCGAGDLKTLSSVECTPHSPTEVTASDYDAAGGVVALGYGDGCFELRRGAAATRSCGAHRLGISNLAFSADGAVLATGDITGNVALSHVAERKTELLANLTSEIRGLAFNPTSTLLAASVETDVVLLDRAGKIAACTSLRSGVHALTFARSGTELIAAGIKLTFLSVPDLRVLNSVVIRKANWHQSAASATDVRVSPDGQTVGTLLTDGTAFFDRRTEQLTVTMLDWAPLGLRFAPDGRVALFARDHLYVGAVDPDGFNMNSSAVADKLADVEFQRDGTVLFVR